MAARKRNFTPASQPTPTKDTDGVFMSQYDKIVEEKMAAMEKEIAELKSALSELQSTEPNTGGVDKRVDVLYSWYEHVKRRV